MQRKHLHDECRLVCMEYQLHQLHQLRRQLKPVFSSMSSQQHCSQAFRNSTRQREPIIFPYCNFMFACIYKTRQHNQTQSLSIRPPKISMEVTHKPGLDI